MKILIPFLVFVGWVGLEIWLATKIVGWSVALTKGAVVWFITAGILLFGGFAEASKNPHFFRCKAIETLAWPALIEFYLNLYQFPLLMEILLQPILAVLTVVSVIASQDKKLHRAKGCAETLLAFAGLTFLAYVTVQTIRGWESLNKIGILFEFALPIGLTVGALPFIYFLAVYAAYEVAFVRMEFRTNIGHLRGARNRLVVLMGLGFRLREISKVSFYWLRQVAEAPSFREALYIIRRYRDDLRRIERQRAEEKQRLIDFAGVNGVDAEGQRLDRREFKATIDALLWVSTCMGGWYNRENRYRTDILDILQGSFDIHGLSDPPGIELLVSPNGQSWYAWRRTITGWCFAIGAAGPPPDEWRYDGAEPPDGFPGTERCWGASSLSIESNLNWHAV
ncbi:MAG: hypothetical protein KJ970_09240 [Candidatus Eisenbacteria bacterium]|uniref:Uncharacterized protein n=1 Tax=Eiseniibacteriota bacterium TaxID=2212470 RepID=A0A948W3H6_UNCEI|nr:hypothetical protein [Candidatus Eisenbacteria bacterium]MBU2691102.1 hypothetical protein [Candidatus Eisenbacteria bacterium]